MKLNQRNRNEFLIFFKYFSLRSCDGQWKLLELLLAYWMSKNKKRFAIFYYIISIKFRIWMRWLSLHASIIFINDFECRWQWKQINLPTSNFCFSSAPISLKCNNVLLHSYPAADANLTFDKWNSCARCRWQPKIESFVRRWSSPQMLFLEGKIKYLCRSCDDTSVLLFASTRWNLSWRQRNRLKLIVALVLEKVMRFSRKIARDLRISFLFA